MSKKEKESYDESFPLSYKGKLWREKDCNDVFLAFYNGPYSILGDGGVYMFHGDYIYPDGTIYNEEDEDEDVEDTLALIEFIKLRKFNFDDASALIEFLKLRKAKTGK